MKSIIEISKELSLPSDAVTEAILVLGQRGMGKTNLLRVFAEEVFRIGIPVVVVDPVGVWWGIRSSADGKSAGLGITVMGGDRGDVPLDPGAGKSAAEFIVEERASAVLDLSGMRKGEATRFMCAFAERLYHAKSTHANRFPLSLVIDEADLFAPQRPQHEEARTLGAIEDLVRRGRARGLGVVVATQRPACLNKNVTTQCGTLAAFRLIGPQDRKAIDAWVEAHGSEAERKELMSSLASLPIGGCWMWSPGWLNLFKKIQVMRARTYDSSSTPKVGAHRTGPKKTAVVDLEKLKTRLSESIERAKSEDPRALRDRIRELESTIKGLKTKPAVVNVVNEVSDTKDLEKVKKLLASIEAVAIRLVKAIEIDISKMAGPIREFSLKAKPLLDEIERREKAAKSEGSWRPRVMLPTSTPAPIVRGHRSSSGSKGGSVSDEVSGPMTKILRALKEFDAIGRETVSRKWVAARAGVSHKSSAFSNNLGALRSKGFIEYTGSGTIRITAVGEACSAPVYRPANPEEMFQSCLNVVSTPMKTILQELRKVGIASREQLATMAGVSAISSAYSNNLGALRSAGMVEYLPDKRIALAEWTLMGAKR